MSSPERPPITNQRKSSGYVPWAIGLIVVGGLAIVAVVAFGRFGLYPQLKEAKQEAMDQWQAQAPRQTGEASSPSSPYDEAVQQSLSRVRARHPEVGKDGTELNRRFDAQTTELANLSPSFFVNPDWPERLMSIDEARQTAGRDVEAWKRVVVLKYPDAGTAGTAFNLELIARTKAKRLSEPSLFEIPEWPVVMADETAKGLKNGEVLSSDAREILKRQTK